jgi:phosphoribosylanthranilate isomerase
MEDSENIFEAYYRINHKLIFMVSCFDPDYAIQYIKNLNNKTFKKYFKVFKSDDPKEFNEIYKKIEHKIIIFVTKLPKVEEYSFNFIKDIFHIHMAVPQWNSNETNEYNQYLDDIKKLPIQKFINVKENKKIYDNNIEDKLFDIMINLIDKKINQDENNSNFSRMPQTGGKLFLYGERELTE